jgi:predicted metal-binding membrane protein
MYKMGFIIFFYHKMSVRKRYKRSRIEVEYWMGTGLMLLDKPYSILFYMLRAFCTVLNLLEEKSK